MWKQYVLVQLQNQGLEDLVGRDGIHTNSIYTTLFKITDSVRKRNSFQQVLRKKFTEPELVIPFQAC